MDIDDIDQVCLEQEYRRCDIPLEESLQQDVNNTPHYTECGDTYQLTENDLQMRRLSDDVKETIEKMNAANRQQEATTDPIAKIAWILTHTEFIQWAESCCTALQRKLDDGEREVEQQRRDQDRTSRFA